MVTEELFVGKYRICRKCALTYPECGVDPDRCANVGDFFIRRNNPTPYDEFEGR